MHPRHFLEEKFESISRSNVKGSLLVDLMEAMHLCCKIPNNFLRSIADLIFISSALSDVGIEQLQWTHLPHAIKMMRILLCIWAEARE